MRSLALFILLLALLPPGVAAQGRAQGISVSPLNNLTFGTVIGGLPATVLPTDPAAGEFLVTAPNKSMLTLTFVVPPALDGPAPLPVTFATGSAGWSFTNLPAGATFFRPQDGAQVTLPPGIKTVYVWIGGSLGTVSPSQPSGSYRATLTLSAAIN